MPNVLPRLPQIGRNRTRHSLASVAYLGKLKMRSKHSEGSQNQSQAARGYAAAPPSGTAVRQCCANCARTFWGELLLLTNWYRAGEPPVPKVCQNPMFFVPLGLALSEKQIPQITENTGK